MFTTRPDTLYGATFMVLAPEHAYTNELTSGTEYEESVKAFQRKLQHLSEIERTATDVEKEGVFIGRHAINPLNGELLPIYIANYVLMDYGTGAIMAVPAHDERDFDFAKKYDLKVIPVVDPENPEIDVENLTAAFVAEGKMINSGEFNGMNNKEGIEKIIEKISDEGIGEKNS